MNELKQLNLKPFEMFDKDFGLVTAMYNGRFNTMTIGWGGFGTIWKKPVATIYVRENRFTYYFLENSEFFTVSFFDDLYKEDLMILGSISGRDTDKISKTKLTPKIVNDQVVTFNEAKITFVCKKIYTQKMDFNQIQDEVIIKRYYKEEPIHTMYIGEIVEVLSR